MEKSYFEKYIIGQIIITILIVLLSYFVYRKMPSLDLINVIEYYKTEYQNTNDSILSILKTIEKSLNTTSQFVEFMKILFSSILAMILFAIQYLFFKQYSFQKTISNNSKEVIALGSTIGKIEENNLQNINKLKSSFQKTISNNSKEIAKLANTMTGIENTLENHFEEYKVIREYARFNNSILHHSFEEALQYDIEQIDKLEQNNIYQSTVLLDDSYLDVIKKNNLLQEYIKTIIEKSRSGVVVQRIFIYGVPLSEDIYRHFDMLLDNKVEVYLLEKHKLNELQRYRQLSKNFIIINKEEVAFAYPFDGKFKFAINLLKSKEREVIRHLDNYTKYFDFMKNKSIEYIKKVEE